MGSNRWADRYTEAARKQGYLARSVFKLREILDAHIPIRKGARVLDLGAAPGSWSQLFLERVGAKGLIVAVDTSPLAIYPLPPQLTYVEGDIHEEETVEKCAQFAPFDIVASDAAPRTTGIAVVDTEASMRIVRSALYIADRLLGSAGHLIVKLFEGRQTKALQDDMREKFQQVKIVHPRARRSSSREIYLLARKKSSRD